MINNKRDITLGIGTVEVGCNGTYHDLGACKYNVDLIVRDNKYVLRVSAAEIAIDMIAFLTGAKEVKDRKFYDRTAAAPTGTLLGGLKPLRKAKRIELPMLGGVAGKSARPRRAVRFTHLRADGARLILECTHTIPSFQLACSEADWNTMPLEFECETAMTITLEESTRKRVRVSKEFEAGRPLVSIMVPGRDIEL